MSNWHSLKRRQKYTWSSIVNIVFLNRFFYVSFNFCKNLKDEQDASLNSHHTKQHYRETQSKWIGNS
jgi:hypothetical protein